MTLDKPYEFIIENRIYLLSFKLFLCWLHSPGHIVLYDIVLYDIVIYDIVIYASGDSLLCHRDPS
ncbi:hypothetical protein [Photorhabdus heterorhabditis]|uniref:hypothetical protein n=1 Tax=Photorhabdus heterorhabditis TaxID=880156 RepID=UPI0015620E3A|nr:hypothetical protein [Photorhabdus heterorhabditis]NRN29313.1 hypothetical protein [Photorhabdus heterorhabditis subsp. aluminescens]